MSRDLESASSGEFCSFQEKGPGNDARLMGEDGNAVLVHKSTTHSLF